MKPWLWALALLVLVPVYLIVFVTAGAGDLFASLVGSLAWPAALFGIVLVLRKQIQALVPRLSKMSVKDVAVFEFSQAVRAVEAVLEEVTVLEPEVEIAPPELPPGTEAEGDMQPAPAMEGTGFVSGPVAPTSAAARLAAISPRAAIIEAWYDVDQALTAAAAEVGETRQWSAAKTADILEAYQRIPEGYARVVEQLRTLRNQAVDDPAFDFNPQGALEYAELAARTARLIRSGGTSS